MAHKAIKQRLWQNYRVDYITPQAQTLCFYQLKMDKKVSPQMTFGLFGLWAHANCKKPTIINTISIGKTLKHWYINTLIFNDMVWTDFQVHSSIVLKQYKSKHGGVCLSDVTSPNVTDSKEKRNQGQSDFLRQKIWQTRKTKFRPWTAQNHFLFYFCIDQDYLFFFFQLLSVPIKGMDEKSVRLDDGTDLGEDQEKKIQALDNP